MNRESRSARRSVNSVSIGDQYGLLHVIGEPVAGSHETFVPVMCEGCGNPSFHPFRLLSKTTNSCGCLRGNIKHRGRRHRTYGIWCNMRERCGDPGSKAYLNYGARGIYVVDEWDSYETFRDWAFESGYDKNLTLERIDNDGPYSPENCRWASVKEQARNRRNTRLIEYENEVKCLKDWALDQRSEVSYSTLYQRVVRLGWDFQTALLTPAAKAKETA